MTLRDILVNILVTANYPQAKRTGFIKSFYEYLMVKILSEIQETNPALHQTLVSYFDDSASFEKEMQEGLREAYKNPELKARIDKVVDEVFSELAKDISKFATSEQKQKILSSLPQQPQGKPAAVS